MNKYSIINVSEPNWFGYVVVTAMYETGITFVYTLHIDIINKRLNSQL